MLKKDPFVIESPRDLIAADPAVKAALARVQAAQAEVRTAREKVAELRRKAGENDAAAKDHAVAAHRGDASGNDKARRARAAAQRFSADAQTLEDAIPSLEAVCATLSADYRKATYAAGRAFAAACEERAKTATAKAAEILMEYRRWADLASRLRSTIGAAIEAGSSSEAMLANGSPSRILERIDNPPPYEAWSSHLVRQALAPFADLEKRGVRTSVSIHEAGGTVKVSGFEFLGHPPKNAAILSEELHAFVRRFNEGRAEPVRAS